MKRSALATGLVAAILAAAASAAGAAVPGQVDFQGLLLDSEGQPATGTVDLDFSLFDAPSGGNLLWTETLLDVPLVDGVYSVTLGATTPITPAVLATGDLYLEISVDGETLSPRRALLAVPFAVRAADADTLGGQPSDFYGGIIEHFAFDGGEPPNDHPTEGTSDVDGDTVPNFVDPDNDNDEIPDGVEVGQGTDINLVTPAIQVVSPDSLELNAPTEVLVTGLNFHASMAVDLEGVPLTPTALTSSDFQVDLTALVEGDNVLTVTLTNGENTSALLAAAQIIPTLTSFSPPLLKVGSPTTITVQGTNLAGDIEVDLEGVPSTPTNVTDTSFQVLVTALLVGDNLLTVTRPGGESASINVPAGTQRRVFVTTATQGNIGGPTGGDAVCAARATALGLQGTFLAWLSNATSAPASRFVLTGGPFIRPNGTQIADDWADLTDGTLDAAIDPSAAAGLWSNTSTSGTYLNNGTDCLGWTSSAPGQTGSRGFANVTSSVWTEASAVTCAASLPIYCFEQ